MFLTPGTLPGGDKNPIHIQRLKDKLGDWSSESSEVELRGAVGWMVGDEGRGVANIIETVALTRQDCMFGSAGLMRQGSCRRFTPRHRKAFKRLLVDQPLTRNVLADLALESEAHLVLTTRVARPIDASARDKREAAFGRLATAVGKHCVCKRAPSRRARRSTTLVDARSPAEPVRYGSERSLPD